MRHYQKAGWVLLAGAAAFGLHRANAADQRGAQREEGAIEQGADPQRAAPDRPPARPGLMEPQGSPRAEKGEQPGAAPTASAEPQCNVGQGQPYTLAPIAAAAPPTSVPYSGFGAGLPAAGGIPPIQGAGAAAPLPQYWLADAALFTGNAANAANVLSLEHGLSVPAPAVLGNQAEFLIAATNRALTSLIALQQNAEATSSPAVSEIRAAIGQLVAAQGAATQVADAVSTGVVGPGFAATTRAALQHLTAAEKAMVGVGRAYNAPALASVGSCPMRGGAFGAGLGPAPRKAPAAPAAPATPAAPPTPAPAPPP